MKSLLALQSLLEPLRSELDLSFAPANALLTGVLKEGGKVLTCGNGGSATQASHFAHLLVVRFQTDRPAFPAIALTDPAVMTAAANDYGYSRVFARQIEALGRPGDLLIALSTSGQSANILEAIAAARRRGMRTLGISSSRMNCDVDIAIPSKDTARIQECTMLVLHMLCSSLEEDLK